MNLETKKNQKIQASMVGFNYLISSAFFSSISLQNKSLGRHCTLNVVARNKHVWSNIKYISNTIVIAKLLNILTNYTYYAF